MLIKKYRIIAVASIALFLLAGVVLWFDRQYVVPIVMYHNIALNPRGLNDTVAPENFRRQLDFLKRNGFHVLRLSELAEGLRSEKKFSRRSVVLTFDDGRENNFSEALPILKEHAMMAMFFVSGEKVATPEYVTWDQLALMRESGMDIGSHGMTETYLPSLSPAQQLREIFESKSVLERHLGERVDFYAYSIGGFSLPIKEMVRQAGYAGAVTTNRGTGRRQDDLFELRRVKLTDGNTSDLVLWFKLSGYYNLFRAAKNPY